MNRKQINQFARSREDKMEKRLVQMGFVLEEDTARRTVRKGDKAMRHEDTGLKILADSKSTQGEKQITLTKEMLEKIRKEAKAYSKGRMGVLIYSFKGDSELYITMNLEDLEGVMY